MPTIKPTGNRVWLMPMPLAEKSPGGILYSPNSAHRDDRMQYRVLAVGPGRKLKTGRVLPPEVSPGHCVLVNPDFGVDLTFKDGSIIVDAGRIEAVWSDRHTPCWAHYHGAHSEDEAPDSNGGDPATPSPTDQLVVVPPQEQCSAGAAHQLDAGLGAIKN